MLLIVLCLICVCQTAQETNNELLNSDSEYDKVEVFNFDDVEYLFFQYQVTFDEAHVICLNYKAQLAVLNTEEKADFIARAMRSTLEMGEFWIGAQSDNADSWQWIDKKQKLNLDHTFYGDLKIWDSPGFASNNDNCLTVYRKRHSIPTFVPLQCSKKRPFICQREIDRFGTRANEIDVIKVNDEEFTLYSARASWAEAVVQCRQKGLQIAEVKSKKVAQAIAMSMLRARPDVMENVWIGGYLKDSSWEWLASSDEVAVNELWPNDTKLLTGCLLLDRHVCEDPVYVSANCDRKRHILCQKPPMKLISKNPSPINVDGCSYWIGFYPLEWLDARRSCQAINASLVILDSPKIIDHMMTLMVDYKQEIRHIWTDGFRKNNETSIERKINHNSWYWSSTGEGIPILGSFIPWCTSEDNLKNTNCLNLDRENHKTPVVYGLSCRKNQTYVCQPWKGHCVSHRVQEDLLKNSEFLNLYSSLADIKSVKTPAIALSQNSSREIKEDVSYVYEDMINMKKLHSTESYYTSSVAYSIPQQVTFLLEEATESAAVGNRKFTAKSDNDNEQEIERIKPEVNETNSQNLITAFFSPLIQFTLPSLPQFGIKVVSAEVTTPNSKVKKITLTSKLKGTAAKIVTRPKNNNRTQVTESTVKNTKMNIINLKQKKGSANLTFRAKNKSLDSVKNISKAKMKSLVTEKVDIITSVVTTAATTAETTAATTEKMDLYGYDVDYYDTSSSKPENSEVTEKTKDYDELFKSLEASGKLSSLLNEDKGNSKSNLPNPFAEILQKRIIDEIQSVLKSELQAGLKNNSPKTQIINKQKYQLKSVDTKSLDLKNMAINKNSNIQRPYTADLIPPYYAFETPLNVELLDNGTGIPISPFVTGSRRNFEEKYSGNTNKKIDTPQTVENSDSLDFQLSQFNPHDKDSMLQLGRFLKNMFAGKNSNAQQIDFNLIARRDISETNQEVIESENKSLPQEINIRDAISPTENYSQNSTVNTTIVATTPQSVSEDKNLINCQKELDSLKKASSKTLSDNLETEYLQEPCKNFPLLVAPPPFRIPRMSSENRNDYSFQNSDQNKNTDSSENAGSSLFNVFKDLVKGIRIDIKEMQLKDYVRRFVRERLPNPEEFDIDSNSGESWHQAFKKILNSLNGTAIRFHGERVQLRFGSFGYKKRSTSKFKSVAHVETTASPKIYDHTISNRQIRDRINYDQKRVQQSQNHGSLSDSLGVSDNQSNNTLENKYLLIPLHSKNNNLSKHNKYKRARNKSNSRRIRQKNIGKIDQDRLESNLKRWSYLKDMKEKLKKVQERESMSENRKDFTYKMFSPSENLKLRNLSSEEDIKNPKDFGNESSTDEKKLQIDSKLSKKFISEANEENPFPYFPVISFDMKRAEDSFDKGFETIRVGRAAKHGDSRDVSSIVSVYIVLKHQNNANGEQISIPILELHVRMPADSLPLEDKHNPDYKTRSVDNLVSKINQETPVIRKIKTSKGTKATQKSQRKLKSRKSRKPKIQRRKRPRNQGQLKNLDLKNIKNHTDLNYEKANNFLRNIIANVTNFKTVPDLKRKRQLLYLALKYLRHVTDEKLRKPSIKDEGNFRPGFTIENNKNRKFFRNSMPNSNVKVQFPHPEVQNFWPSLYPGLDNRPLVFNPVENELNPKRGLLNRLPVFNYNTRRYDEMPFNTMKRSYNTRMRRNVEFFLDNEELNNN